MSAEDFTAELAGKPAALNALADRLARGDPYAALPSLLDDEPAEVVFLGLGSARYACEAAAARLHRVGASARAEFASDLDLAPPDARSLIVAVGIGGARRELIEALEHLTGSAPVIVLTEPGETGLTRYADIVVPLHAERERSKIPGQSYQHALAALLQLCSRLGAPLGAGADISVVLRRTANAAADLLERATDWVPKVAAALESVSGVHVLAPPQRLASARQAAFTIRKGPVRAAHASETAEWSHTDRYLAAIEDYRALLLAGSRYDERAAEQIAQLRGAFVSVGDEVEGAVMNLRYPGDGDETVRLLTEPLVAELLAAHWWRGG